MVPHVSVSVLQVCQVIHKLEEQVHMKSKRSLPKRELYLGAFAVCCLIITGLVWRSRIPERPVEAAKKLVDAALEADGRVLMKYATSEEIAANNLNEGKLSRLYQEVIIPRLGEGWNRMTLDLQDASWQGVASAGLQYPDGQIEHFTMDTFPDGSKPKCAVTQVVLRAWVGEYSRNSGGKLSPTQHIDALLKGLREDRAKLESIGILYLASVDIRKGVIEMLPISNLDARYTAWKGQLSENASATRQTY